MPESYMIIPDGSKVETEMDISKVKTAVLVHLFYEDQVGDNKGYLERIPDGIDIIIISSQTSILDQFSDERYIKIKKENRGRDISALLIASKEIIFEYQYVCFVHDKRERHVDDKEYVDFWRKNMWDNMLQSYAYICNILDVFERDSRIGMLVPLPPHQGDKGVWLKGDWGGTYDLVRNLADEIGVSVDISYDPPPFTYSTVFWARTGALGKLFSKEWVYTDFPDEPMRDTGEINHAVERILQYVAEDAGYEVKIVLSSTFASEFIMQLKTEISGIWNRMGAVLGIRGGRDIGNFGIRVEKLRRLKEMCSHFYLYGAGEAGRNCLKICTLLGIKPVGILVTDLKSECTSMEGIRILPIVDFEPSDDTGVVITVYESVYKEEIKKRLDNIGFQKYVVF